MILEGTGPLETPFTSKRTLTQESKMVKPIVEEMMAERFDALMQRWNDKIKRGKTKKKSVPGYNWQENYRHTQES